MTCDIHLTDTTHCPERVFNTHNSTPHERKIGTENMTAEGTRNSTLNILFNIQPLRYMQTKAQLQIAALAQIFSAHGLSYLEKGMHNQNVAYK